MKNCICIFFIFILCDLKKAGCEDYPKMYFQENTIIGGRFCSLFFEMSKSKENLKSIECK